MALTKKLPPRKHNSRGGFVYAQISIESLIKAPSLQPWPADLCPEWPGHRSQNDNQGHQKVPERPLELRQIRNIFLRRTPADRDQYDRDQHPKNMFDGIKPIAPFLHYSPKTQV